MSHTVTKNILLAVIAGSSLCSTAGWSAPFFFGAGIHAGQNKIGAGETLALMESTGINSFRDEVFWHRLETEKDLLIFPKSLQDLDNLTTAVAKKGNTPLIILDYGNKFYDSGDIPTTTVGIEGFARYAKFTANHFKGRVGYYEIWNEWNIGMGSNQKPRTIRSVQQYINLMRPAIAAVREVDPTAKIIAGSVCHADDKWIDKFIALGGLKGIDGFSVHPYIYDEIKNNRPEDIGSWLSSLSKKLTNANQGRPIDIYVTEIGWPSHQGSNGWSEKQTGDFLLRLYMLSKAQPNIRGLWWYELRDSGENPNEREHNFGLASKKSGAKPALRAMTTAISILSKATSVNISQPSKGIYRASINSPDQQCTAYWTREGSLPYNIPNSDLTGNLRWGQLPSDSTKGSVNETPLIICRTLSK